MDFLVRLHRIAYKKNKMIKTNKYGLNRSGMAALSDMECPEYKKYFSLLEADQEYFLDKEQSFRSQEYKWPRDSLHCWSRIWEYPYVYYHLKNEKKLGERTNIRVVDFGSGVTFFPFSVARLGCHVQCLDIDPICEKDLQRAALTVDHNPGKVTFSPIRNSRSSLKDSEADAVYCISVLEHIPDFELSLLEIVRILKPNGLFILTIDIDMCGYNDIGAKRYYEMRKLLDCYFSFQEIEVSTHPLDILTQYRNVSLLRQIKFQLKQQAKAILNKNHNSNYPNLAVWGGVMQKR